MRRKALLQFHHTALRRQIVPVSCDMRLAKLHTRSCRAYYEPCTAPISDATCVSFDCHQSSSSSHRPACLSQGMVQSHRGGNGGRQRCRAHTSYPSSGKQRSSQGQARCRVEAHASIPPAWRLGRAGENGLQPRAHDGHVALLAIGPSRGNVIVHATAVYIACPT